MRRSDIERAWRDLVGELSAAQSGVVLGTAAAGGIAVAVGTARGGGGWLRSALMGGMAVDLVGGLVAFQLSPTRERYARTDLGSRIRFVAGHLQPFALPIAGQGSWRRASLRYSTAISAASALELLPIPEDSRRLLAGSVGIAAGLIDLVTIPADQPQRWFGPVYLIKLIAGHGGISRAR